MLVSAMDRLPPLRPAVPGRRARPAAAPSEERLRELARAVSDGSYRVEPSRVAEAMLTSRRPAG